MPVPLCIIYIVSLGSSFLIFFLQCLQSRARGGKNWVKLSLSATRAIQRRAIDELYARRVAVISKRERELTPIPIRRFSFVYLRAFYALCGGLRSDGFFSIKLELLFPAGFCWDALSMIGSFLVFIFVGAITMIEKAVIELTFT